MSDRTKQINILAFTSYGNFLRHLYSFYEGIIKEKNENLLRGLKKDKIGIEISELLTKEVKKLIRNKRFVYENNPLFNIREIASLNEDDVPENFGTHFRYIRNRFSHIDGKRVKDNEISMSEFYKLYHKYVLLLFDSASSTWSIKEEEYDFLEVEHFMSEISQWITRHN